MIFIWSVVICCKQYRLQTCVFTVNREQEDPADKKLCDLLVTNLLFYILGHSFCL